MNRLIAFLIAAVLLWAPPASATYYTHVWDNVTLGQSGHAVQGASIYVYDHADSSAHAVFSDMAETAITQPITTDADGFWEFYIEPEADVFIRRYKASLAIDDTVKHIVSRFSAANVDTVTALVATAATITNLTVSDRADADTLAADVGRFRFIGGLYDNYAYGIGPSPTAVDSARFYDLMARNVVIPTDRSMRFERRNTGKVMRLGGGAMANFSLGTQSQQFYNQSAISWTAPIVKDHVFAADGTLAVWLESEHPLFTYPTGGDTLYAKYDDNGIISMQVTGADTNSFHQSVAFANTRDDTLWWGYFGPVKWGDEFDRMNNTVLSSPNTAFSFVTDLADSNGAGGEKTIIEVRRDGDTFPFGGWLNPESAYLELVDGRQTKYAFQRDYLRMYGDGNRTASKNTPITLGWYEGTHDWGAADDTLKASIVPSDSYEVLTLATTVTDAYVYIDDLLRLKPRAAPADTVGRGGLIYFSSGATPHLYVLHGGTWHQLDN